MGNVRYCQRLDFLNVNRLRKRFNRGRVRDSGPKQRSERRVGDRLRLLRLREVIAARSGLQSRADRVHLGNFAGPKIQIGHSLELLGSQKTLLCRPALRCCQSRTVICFVDSAYERAPRDFGTRARRFQ